jgi:creatinine amidohydrolase
MNGKEYVLTAMTTAQIRALPDRERAVVLVTTGAIEQHGPHLPLAFDALMGQVWIERVLARLPQGVACYVAPPITIGKSNEHAGFAGTLMISKETLRRQLHAIARQVEAWGFRRIAVLNTHGGNTSVLKYAVKEMAEAFGVEVTLLEHRAMLEPAMSAQEATYGFHAGELETSWLLAVASELVRMERAVREYPARLEDAGELRPEAAPATFAWVTQDVSASGVMGDATAATAEKGAAWIKQIVAGYVARIVELANEGRGVK